MDIIKYELKYCERCGTLKLRLVSSATNYCLACERMLARFRLSSAAANAGGLEIPGPAELKMLAGIPLSVRGEVATGRVQ